MSWKKTRARRRRARDAAEHARIAAKIKTLRDRVRDAQTPDDRVAANEELMQLMKGIADADRDRLWPFFSRDFFGTDESGTNQGTRSEQEPGPRATGKVAREEVETTKALIADLIRVPKPPRWVRGGK